jgi:5-methyltetrahydrofolate--homocysteine methyltransferase
MAKTIWTLLEATRPLLGDGAMGTMLQQAGLTDGGAPELWNVERPDVVRGIYRAYAEAGAHLISTNTFGGNLARLQFHQIGDRVHELNAAGARLAREVADDAGILVAGSMGPSGDLIEPVGELGMVDARALFAEEARGLIDGGVDLILIETMSHLNEVQAAIEGVRQIAPDFPIAATMSFDTNLHTMMGVSPRSAMETIAGWDVRITGANCGNGPAEIEAVMTQMARYRVPGIYLMAQSNAGLPQYVEGRIQYDGTPEIMADYALKMRNLGIDIIGACCGSTPVHIAEMHAALQRARDLPIAGPPPIPAGEHVATESEAAQRAARRAARRQTRQQRAPGGSA